MRVFRDSNSTDWTVFEVKRQVGSSGELALLPGGFSNGWLCFENASTKRRLVPYPEQWREFSDGELEELLGRAAPAPRGSFRLGEGLGENASPSAEA